MALLDDGLKGWGTGLLIGVGIALAAPVILPAAAAMVRPLAKGLIRGYLALADMAQELEQGVSSEGGQGVEKIVEEVVEDAVVEVGEALIEGAG